MRRPRRSPLALSALERQGVLDVLHSPEYADVAPHTAYAMLLDAGIFPASASTFYRILRTHSGTRGRRNELAHPAYVRPELLAMRRARCGRGISPRSRGRSSPRISTSTSSSILIAVTWSAG